MCGEVGYKNCHADFYLALLSSAFSFKEVSWFLGYLSTNLYLRIFPGYVSECLSLCMYTHVHTHSNEHAYIVPVCGDERSNLCYCFLGIIL